MAGKRCCRQFLLWMASIAVLGGAAELRAQEQASQKPTGAAAAIANVPAALAKIPGEGRVLSFALGSQQLPRGGHLQGVQMFFDAAAHRHIALLSHDSETVAYLAVVEFPEDLTAAGRVIAIHNLPSDGKSPPLRHAGGFQLLGRVLAIGLEDNQQKTRSEIRFVDVAQPEKPVALEHLTIRRAGLSKEMTAGAVGLVARERDHLVAVANWDSRAVDFYISNCNPLDHPQCRFEHYVRWRDDAAMKGNWHPDREFGAYQAINLVADAGHDLFLIGFCTDPANQDFVDLFAVAMNQDPDRLLRKVARKRMKLQANNHFRYSGGLWLEAGKPTILSSPAALQGEVRINLVR